MYQSCPSHDLNFLLCYRKLRWKETHPDHKESVRLANADPCVTVWSLLCSAPRCISSMYQTCRSLPFAAICFLRDIYYVVRRRIIYFWKNCSCCMGVSCWLHGTWSLLGQCGPAVFCWSCSDHWDRLGGCFMFWSCLWQEIMRHQVLSRRKCAPSRRRDIGRAAEKGALRRVALASIGISDTLSSSVPK